MKRLLISLVILVFVLTFIPFNAIAYDESVTTSYGNSASTHTSVYCLDNETDTFISVSGVSTALYANIVTFPASPYLQASYSASVSLKATGWYTTKILLNSESTSLGITNYSFYLVGCSSSGTYKLTRFNFDVFYYSSNQSYAIGTAYNERILDTTTNLRVAGITKFAVNSYGILYYAVTYGVPYVIHDLNDQTTVQVKATVDGGNVANVVPSMIGAFGPNKFGVYYFNDDPNPDCAQAVIVSVNAGSCIVNSPHKITDMSASYPVGFHTIINDTCAFTMYRYSNAYYTVLLTVTGTEIACDSSYPLASLVNNDYILVSKAYGYYENGKNYYGVTCLYSNNSLRRLTTLTWDDTNKVPVKYENQTLTSPAYNSLLNGNLIVSHGSDHYLFWASSSSYVNCKKIVVAFEPVANFHASAVSGDEDVSITFYDDSQFGPSNWTWHFGDGTVVSGDTTSYQNVVHTYTVAGTYTVTLVISNLAGSDSEVKTNYITINSTAGSGGATSITSPEWQLYMIIFFMVVIAIIAGIWTQNGIMFYGNIFMVVMAINISLMVWAQYLDIFFMIVVVFMLIILFYRGYIND